MKIIELGAVHECATADSFEVFVADDVLEGGAFEGGASGEVCDGYKVIGEIDAFEGGALLECAHPNSFEVFVADEAFEGKAFVESHLSDDFEHIGESDTREGVAASECVIS